jgi:acyl-CoA dehydrogenase
VVERGTEGFTVGRSLSKMGWRSSDTAELVFTECRIPADNLIGDEHAAFYYIMENFQNERLVLAGQSLGEAQRAVELTVDHVRSRRAFGGPLWDRQVIRQRLAMDQARLDAARQLTYHAAWLAGQGVDVVREVSEVKALVGELVNEVLYDCVQFHGGMGFIAETAVERLYRDVRVQSIGGGATEVMLDEVAKRM